MSSTSTSTAAAGTSIGPGTVHVIGATGKTGRRVVDRLERAGIPVEGRSRRSQPPFDWQDRSTWAPAIEGASALYLTYVPDLAVDGAPEDVADLVALARAAGVEHVVLLSGRGEANARRAELVVEASGLAWTVVRASWFMQNLSEGALLEGVLSGLVALPAGDVPEPFVDLEDVADVVVAALTDPALRGRVHEVTGPASLTFAQAVAEIAAVTGREVTYLAMDPEDFREAVAAQAGADYAQMLTDLCVEVFDGRNVHPVAGVQAALGRPPRSLEGFVRAEAAAGAWR
ncbi:NAD(P)H-binding protein [Actinotalea sp. K2]|uniref:NmrA family NAD(P)-binding protein n=1 Tax=Actinotalea sp. K2 TaxID=2939438 RepID=UPI0020176A4C|nr:NAD(P)H-binding protein [Actinotalea sp. K2]MCL3859715.1 NAD(P)H-binding protein [Actinotalea sp. K2]